MLKALSKGVCMYTQRKINEENDSLTFFGTTQS